MSQISNKLSRKSWIISGRYRNQWGHKICNIERFDDQIHARIGTTIILGASGFPENNLLQVGPTKVSSETNYLSTGELCLSC